MSRRKKQKHASATRTLPNGAVCARCTSTSKRTGIQCGASALRGSDPARCPLHLGTNADGSSHAGPANGNWQGGTSKPRYEGPAVFNERVLAAQRDPHLLDQTPEIAVITTLLQETVALLKPGIDPASFQIEVDRLVTGMRTSSSDEIRAAVNNLVALSSSASGQRVIENRILRLFEKRRKLIESQRRRAAELALAMPRAEVLRVSIALLEAVTRHVNDAPTLIAIREEIRGVIGDGTDDGSVH